MFYLFILVLIKYLSNIVLNCDVFLSIKHNPFKILNLTSALQWHSFFIHFSILALTN